MQADDVRDRFDSSDESMGQSYVSQSDEIRKALSGALSDDEAQKLETPYLKTCIRVRPPLYDELARYGNRIPGMGQASFAQFEYESCMVDKSSRREVVVLSEERKIGKPTGKLTKQRFSADEAFGGSNDDEVFEGAVGPLVKHALAGGRAAFIAFGQTGAGKTHTCLAMQRRAAAALLAAHGVAAVVITFLELYGERPADLLLEPDASHGSHGSRSEVEHVFHSEDGSSGGGGDAGKRSSLDVSDAPSPFSSTRSGGGEGRVAIALRENSMGELIVSGLSEVVVSSAEAAEAVLNKANRLRAAAPTAANERSSRSHAICTLRPVFVAGGDADDSSGVGNVGDGQSASLPPQLVLVDLAGSERREDVGVHSRERMEETKATNMSLSALKDCVRLKRHSSAAGGGQHVVPYRQSKLTRLLKPFLEGVDAFRGATGSGDHPMACVVAHLSPLRSAGKHTASTLEFVGSLCGVTRQAVEKANFNRVEAWTPSEVARWIRSLDDGKYERLAPCFGGYTGKMLSIEWLGHVVKRVCAEGGDEADAHRIYEAFHELHRAAKLEAEAASFSQHEQQTRKDKPPSRFKMKAALQKSHVEFEIFEGPRKIEPS